MCAVDPSPCFSPDEFGSNGYAGPGTTLTPAEGNDAGTVSFAGGMSPGGATYFSLAAPPQSGTSTTSPDIGLTVPGLTLTTGVPFTGTIGTFTDGHSTAPASDFSAGMNWGDGQTSTSTVSQPGGPGTPYVVTDTHTYAEPATYDTDLTVTDVNLPGNTASAPSSAVVATQAVVITPATIAPQLTGPPGFSGLLASFTDSDPVPTPASFAVTIDWGAQSGGMEQTGTGTVTQPGGPGTPFDIDGSNVYSQSGEFTIVVTVSYGGITTVADVPIEVDLAESSQGCTQGSTCTGQVGTPQQEVTASTKGSAGGSVQLSLADGTFDCGTGYDSAPQITTVSTVQIPSTVKVDVKVVFAKSAIVGPAGAPLAVCFEANDEFTDASGGLAPPQTIDGQTVYVGLLRTCRSAVEPRYGPCVGSIVVPKSASRTLVTENIRFPGGDPKFS